MVRLPRLVRNTTIGQRKRTHRKWHIAAIWFYHKKYCGRVHRIDISPRSEEYRKEIEHQIIGKCSQSAISGFKAEKSGAPKEEREKLRLIREAWVLRRMGVDQDAELVARGCATERGRKFCSTKTGLSHLRPISSIIQNTWLYFIRLLDILRFITRAVFSGFTLLPVVILFI